MPTPLLRSHWLSMPSSSKFLPLVFIHGLFGEGSNFRSLAKHFAEDRPVLLIDLPNHGKSPKLKKMDYPTISIGLKATFDALKIEKMILVGHSLGGKVAMQFAGKFPESVEKLIVIDIAPVPYENRHRAVFQTLRKAQEQNIQKREIFSKIGAEHFLEEKVISFLLKSFEPNMPHLFRFDVELLEKNYSTLMDWQKVRFEKPTLFIKGSLSDYILPLYQRAIVEQFPDSQGKIIYGAGHWVHGEKPQSVIRAIEDFLNKVPE